MASGQQQMMHGPLTIEQAEHVRQMDTRCSYGERVFRIVEAWPPLTDAQLNKLAVLLQPERGTRA